MIHRILLAAVALATLAACDSQTGGEASPASTRESTVDGTALVAGPAGVEAFLDCLSEERVTIISAHRGGPAPGYPENAMATFAHTVARVPAMLEVDVQQTADDALVLLHDSELSDGTTCSGEIDETPLADLAACRLRDDSGRATDHRIPTLAEALDWSAGRTLLELDIKPSADFERVVEAVRDAGAEERVVLIVYSLDAAARLASIAPELAISAPVDSLDDLAQYESRGVDIDEILAWTGTRATDASLCRELDDRDVPVIFGTLGRPDQSIDGAIARSRDEDRYVTIASDGVDILATDRPVEAYAALAADRDPARAIASCRTMPRTAPRTAP